MSQSASVVLQTAGVNDIWHYNELHLDSSARDGGTNDEPTFVLPDPLHDVMGVKVLSAHIPFSYYLVHDDNNSFLFTFWSDQAATGHRLQTVPLSLSPGSYSTPDDCAQSLADDINAAWIAFWQAPNRTTQPPYLYAVRFHPSIGAFELYATKLVNGIPTPVTVANNDCGFQGLSFQFQVGLTGESCAPVFGFQPSVVYGSVMDDPVTTDNANEVTYSVIGKLVNLAGPSYLQLFSNLGNRISNRLLVNGTTTSSPPVLARIPVNAPPYGTISYTDPNPSFAFDVGLSQLQNISLSLRLGRQETHPLHLNDQAWSIVLLVLTQRDTSAGRLVYPPEGGNKRIRVR